MMETAASLFAHKAGSAATLPLRVAAGTPPWWEWMRELNSSFDALFYDVGKVTPAESALLGPHSAREGAILIVPPTDCGMLTVCTSVPDFLGKGGARVRSLAIAGVGSSALGTAAFARNVANATGAPVAGVVSGFGASDALSEGLGGYFWFGALNRLRHSLTGPCRTRSPQAMTSGRALVADTAGRALPAPPDPMARGNDLLVLLDLLASPDVHFTLMTGHSKGNLVLAEALHLNAALARLASRPVDSDPLIVTFSAAIAVPCLYRNIVDVLGALDWFGLANSTPGIAIERRPPGSAHHTNTQIPGHLPVTCILNDILAHPPMRA